MKKLLSILLVCFAFNSFCQPGTTIPKKQNITETKVSTKAYEKPTASGIILTVFPETIPCNDDANSQCLQIQKKGSDDFETVADIENFNYDLGYTYTILVKQIMKNPPIKINESIYRYVWLKTLSKKEVSNEITSTNQGTTNTTFQSSTTNGKIIGQPTIQSSSPLDGKWYLRKMKEAEGSSFVTDENIMWIDIKTFKDRIDGYGACNSFATVVKSDLKTTFEVSKLTSNYAFCGNKKIEDLFYDLLQQTDRFEIRNGNLFLSKQWNNLLIFTSNPDNKEEISEKYTKPAIVKSENTTYATNETLKNNYSEENNILPTKKENVQPIINDEIEAKNKEIEALKKQLAAQQNAPIKTSTNNTYESTTSTKTYTEVTKPIEKTSAELEQEKLDQEAAALKKQLAEKKAKEEADKALALQQQQQQQQAEAKKQADLDKIKLEKQKEIEELKKQLAEKEANLTTTTIATTSKTAIVTKPVEATNANNDEQDIADEKPLNKISTNYVITKFVANKTNNIPDPEFPLRPYYLDGQELIKLERAEANFAAKQKGIYRGVDMQVQIMKEESPIQFLKNNIPRFFITINDDDIDPFDVIDLCKADRIGKGRRNFTYAGKKYGGRVKDVTGKLISLDFKKIRKGVYEIIIDQELKQGEYAFLPLFKNESLSSTNSIKANCFGIVDPEK